MDQRTPPELTTPSPIFHTTSTGRRLSSQQFLLASLPYTLDLQSYTRAFVDGPRNIEPWSSDEDAPELTPPLLTTNGRMFDLSTDLMGFDPLHGTSLGVLDLDS
ncbi:hypothetical protein TNCV_742071 [Trichonephila clavipes]|nr:hypothetical protein TNCV_742071 [Trichonephila clavipes]